jgi:hypothetical protein
MKRSREGYRGIGKGKGGTHFQMPAIDASGGICRGGFLIMCGDDEGGGYRGIGKGKGSHPLPDATARCLGWDLEVRVWIDPIIRE